MRIISTNIYVGPNVYANFPVIKHVIDIEELENWPSVKLGSDFIEGLIAAVPTLASHGCSYSVDGGFIRRLKEDEGTWIGHIWEHVTLELQSLAGSDVSFGKTRDAGTEAHYNLVFEYKQKDVGLRACELARDLLISLLPKKVAETLSHKVEADFDFPYELRRFIKFSQSKQFGPSTQSLIDAAAERNVPYLRLNEQSLVQFGYGKHQKRIQATITSETTHIAVQLASDKAMTNNILDSLGLPVPKQRNIRSKAEVLRAAREVGYPVVVKPLDGNHGRGISINLTTPEQVETAYDVAREVASVVIVESYITGDDHRLLVVNGKLVAASKRVPGHVVGDNKHTIAELIDIVNSDPRRGVGHEKVLTKLELDYQAQVLMEKEGYTASTILPEGKICYLRDTANLSTGGTAIDLTDQIHPDNRDMAERAVRAIGLDVGGVDFLIPDLSQSYHDVGGAIVEVNAAPGFRMHVAPTEGKPRDVAGAVLDMLFPDPTVARVPIVTITGTNGKTTTSRMVAHLWKSAGKIVGLTTTDGIYINGKLTVSGDTTGPKSAHMVLQDPTVEVAVLETARGGLLRSGMGYEYCNVGACLNVTADHIGLKGVNDLSDLAKVKQIVTDAARDMAILNADDINCLKMSSTTKAKDICYVTMNPQHNLVKEHIRLGGKAVIIEKGVNGDMITIFDNHVHMPVLWTYLIPATLEGKAIHNVQNAMFAVAIAYGMGMSLDEIRNGLRTFVNNFYQTPGRMNMFEELPFKVMLDYGHNPAAIGCVGKYVQQVEITGKKTCVIALPGDRPNELIEESVKLLPQYFDEFICKQDDNRRKRADGEIPALIRELLIKYGAKPESIRIIADEVEAVDTALNTAKEGDFLTIFGDNIKRTWKQIIHFHSGAEKVTKSTKVESTFKLVDDNEANEMDLAIKNSTVKRRGNGIIVEADDEEDLND